MLCYLRYPGRPLQANEQPAAALVSFVADQIDVLPETIDDHPGSEQNRRRHAVELQDQFGLRPFGTRTATELTSWLLPHAIENDQLAHLVERVLEECRRRRVIIPRPQRLERLCIEARHRARREVQRRLTEGLSADQRQRLDALSNRREETNQTWLTWLRQMPEAAKPVAMLGLIERLDHVRAIGLDSARGHRVHQARLAQLAREASRTTAQHVAGQADGRAINEKVRLYARVGAALISAHDGEQDAFGAITAVISWERFRATVAEAQALARPETFDAYQKMGEHYAGIRRWSPAFLAAFEFESVPTSASLMRAIEVLREVNNTGASVLPKSAPTGFVRQRWASYVLPGGEIDRRHYELCVLSELRDRLLAGEVWVTGSRRHRSFEERLLSRETVRELRQAGTLLVAIEMDFDKFIESRRSLLDKRMAAVDARARDDLLPGVTITKGVLKIASIEKSTPPEAEALAARVYAMLPRIRVTDLLAEVAGWTRFPECFTHLRTGETAADNRVFMAGLLAEGLNLGLTRMAEACSIASLGQLAWTSDWHIREET
jgi:hypothetical protein